MLAVARPDSVTYEIVYLLHLLTVIVGVGASFVPPVLARLAGDLGPQRLGALSAGLARRLITPWLVAAGVLGGALVPLSDGIYEFSQAWVSIAFAAWGAAAVVAIGFLHPTERRLAAATDRAEAERLERRTAALGGVLHLLVAVLLVDMVFKPGF